MTKHLRYSTRNSCYNILEDLSY